MPLPTSTSLVNWVILVVKESIWLVEVGVVVILGAFRVWSLDIFLLLSCFVSFLKTVAIGTLSVLQKIYIAEIMVVIFGVRSKKQINSNKYKRIYKKEYRAYMQFNESAFTMVKVVEPKIKAARTI